MFPVLDMYDCMHTPPGADRPVITSVEYGFYYELASLLTLEEHDEHITALIGDVQDVVDEAGAQTQWLFEEWGLTAPDMRAHWGETAEALAALGVSGDWTHEQLAMILEQLSGMSDEEVLTLLWTVADQVGQIREQTEGLGMLPDMVTLLLMFGIEADEVGMEPNPYLPPFSFVEEVSDLYQKLNGIQGSVDSFFDVFTELDLGDAVGSLATQESVDEIAADLESLEAKVDLIIEYIENTPGVGPPGGGNGKGGSK